MTETRSDHKKVAITGSAGYIGRELLVQLQRSKLTDEILAIDRLPQEPREGVIAHKLDLASCESTELAAAIVHCDTVFHLAAARTDWGLSHKEYERDNVLATRKLIEAARRAGIRRWVYYGTVGVYGSSDAALNESAPFKPTSSYAETKAKAEEELLAAAIEEGWDVRIIRPSAVFSEFQPDNTNLYRLIEAIRKNRFILVGSGSAIKTTSYLHNLVDATLWLYSDLSAGGVAAFNYVDEPKLTTREMIDIIRAGLNTMGPLLRIPLAVVERPARLLDWLGDCTGRDLPITSARIRKFCTATNFDSSKIRNAGFRPRYSSVDAIKRTVAWHAEGCPDTNNMGESL